MTFQDLIYELYQARFLENNLQTPLLVAHIRSRDSSKSQMSMAVIVNSL